MLTERVQTMGGYIAVIMVAAVTFSFGYDTYTTNKIENAVCEKIDAAEGDERCHYVSAGDLMHGRSIFTAHMTDLSVREGSAKIEENGEVSIVWSK